MFLRAVARERLNIPVDVLEEHRKAVQRNLDALQADSGGKVVTINRKAG